MRPSLSLIPLAALLAAAPARAQRANHSISLESGASRLHGTPLVPVALSASAWLDGDLHGTARVSGTFAPRTGGRGADRVWSGTFGLRFAPGTAALRPDAVAELGWALAEEGGHARQGVALGLGCGLEWFLARDLSLSSRAVLRRAATPWRLEVVLAASAYF
jgi:hypothetical protein